MLTATSSFPPASCQRRKTVHRIPPGCGYRLVASRVQDVVSKGILSMKSMDAIVCVHEFAGDEAREMIVDPPHDLDYKFSKLGSHDRHSTSGYAMGLRAD